MWVEREWDWRAVQQEPAESDESTGVSLPAPQILIVDDTPANLLAFEAAIEPLGYRIVTAHSGYDALRYLLIMDFSLILMDVQMPDMNGIETVKLIKQSKRHRHIPILFITAICRQMSFVLEGYQVGAVDYILKPCEPDVLRSKVAALVGLFRQKEIVKKQAALLHQREREDIERRAELRFEALIQAMPIIVWAADADGHFYYANNTWSQYTGTSSGQTTTEEILNTLHPDDRDHARASWQEALECGRAIDVQARFRRRDGVYRWHLSRAVPQREEGRVTGWIITATDIEEQKRAEEAEQKARKEAEAANCELMKDEFLTTVSHELRTPLTAIVGWSNLLRSGTLNGANTERGLASIARNAEAEKRVVEDILDISRIASGKLLVHLLPLDPAAIVYEVSDVLRPIAKAKGIALESTVKSSGALMLGDPDRLWQVIWKLVFNAIKFTSSGGRVDVNFEHLGERFILTVSDTGEGILSDVLPHVFGCFSQEDRTPKRKHGGLGLGLAIVRRLVELHGGSVSAASAGKGLGATFTATLPSCAAPDARLSRSDPKLPATYFDRFVLVGLRVLVITDDVETRILMAEVLERRGATVLSVATAEDAVALVAESLIDVVVSDWNAKGVDEPLFAQTIKSLDDRPLPLIAVTDAADAEHARQALSAGFEGYIAKPIHPAHLVAAITSFGRRGAALQQAPNAL